MQHSKVLLELGPFKGVNQSQSAEHTAMDSAVDARNITTDDGAIRTVRGTGVLTRMDQVQNFPQTHSIHAIGSNILGLYYKQNGAQRGIGVYCVNGNNVTLDTGSYMETATNVTIVHTLNMQGYHNDVYQPLLAVSLLIETASSKRAVVQAFTQSGANSFKVDLNKGMYLATYVYRLFTANAPHNTNHITYSRLMDPSVFQVDGSLLASAGELAIADIQDGDIVGLFTATDSMLIFKRNGVWRALGSTVQKIELTRLDGTLRPIGGENCVLLGGISYFMTQEGIAQFDGLRVRLLPENAYLRSLWQTLFPPGGSPYTNAVRMIAHRQKIYCLFRSPSVLVVFDTQRRTFSVLEGHGAGSITSGSDFAHPQSNMAPLLICHNAPAIIQLEHGNRYFAGFSAGAPAYSPIEAYWETPRIGLPGISKIKSTQRIYINANGLPMDGTDPDTNPARLRVALYSERDNDAPRQRDIVLHDQSMPTIQMPRLRHRGRVLKMRIQNLNGCAFCIPNMTVRMRDKEV